MGGIEEDEEDEELDEGTDYQQMFMDDDGDAYPNDDDDLGDEATY